MNQEIKQKWVEALESGKYKQGKGRLKSDDAYCCLGVLCDLYINETGNGEWIKEEKDLPEDSPKHAFMDNGIVSDLILPFYVKKWAGLDSSSPCVGDKPLVDLNDFGSSFKEIAQLINQYK